MLPFKEIPSWIISASEIITGVFIATYLGFVAFKGRLKTMIEPEQKQVQSEEELLTEKYSRIFNNISDIHTEMQEYVHELGASRVIVLYTENGGGIPNSMNHIYSSILYEVNDGRPPIKKSWQRELIDKDYSMLIANLSQGGHVVFTDVITDLTDHSMLKNIYLATNVRSSIVCRILTTEKRFYYLSVTWNRPLDEKEVDNLQFKIKTLVNYIKERLVEI